jgi:hypothetical protein
LIYSHSSSVIIYQQLKQCIDKNIVGGVINNKFINEFIDK